MQSSHLARAAFCLIALVLVSGLAIAKGQKEENKYPNATRAEPKVELTESDQRSYNKAVKDINDDKTDDAIAELDKILASSRSSKYAQALAHNLKGQIDWQNDKEAEAMAEIAKAIELDAMPNDNQFAAIYQLAQLQVNSEKYADAQANLTKWRKLSGSETAEAYALEANVEYRLEKYPEAVTAMKKAISMTDKPSASWTQILMASYLEQDKYGEAAAMLQGQIAKDPTNKSLINQLANIYLQSDQDQKALDLMAKAKADGLISTSADYLQLAKLYAAGDKPKQAAATLKDGIDKGIVKTDYDTWKLLGDVCTQAEDDACALDAYTKASPLAKDGDVDYHLGYVLFYAGKSAQAVEALERAFAKGSLRQPGEAYILLGDAENDLNQSAKARAEWQKALAYPTTKAMAEQRIKLMSKGAKIKRGKK